MAHNIEIKQGIASFAENAGQGKKNRAWHGLGDDSQIFDRPMSVAEALTACHADYQVEQRNIFALTDEIRSLMEQGADIPTDMLLKALIKGNKATLRTDLQTTLGVVGAGYGVVQNSECFAFVDTLCSGKVGNADNTPVIETCGVLGAGERVFVSAKFPKQIVLDSKRDDLMDVYLMFTNSHDGSGAVKCLVTPVRVVCNNTLNWALQNNVGRVTFRHTSRVSQRIDLFNEENAKFATTALGIAEVYTNALQESYAHLRSIKLAEQDLTRILAELALQGEPLKAFRETGNIYDERIKTRGRNIFLGMREALESGVGQEGIVRGTGEWVMNGVTTFFQNHNKENEDQRVKFDSVLSGNIYGKVNKAYELLTA